MNAYLASIRIPIEWSVQNKLRALSILDVLHTDLHLSHDHPKHPFHHTHRVSRNDILLSLYEDIPNRIDLTNFFFASNEYHNWLQNVMDAYIDLA